VEALADQLSLKCGGRLLVVTVQILLIRPLQVDICGGGTSVHCVGCGIRRRGNAVCLDPQETEPGDSFLPRPPGDNKA
jgi:hypothetical protein